MSEKYQRRIPGSKSKLEVGKSFIPGNEFKCSNFSTIVSRNKLEAIKTIHQKFKRQLMIMETNTYESYVHNIIETREKLAFLKSKVRAISELHSKRTKEKPIMENKEMSKILPRINKSINYKKHNVKSTFTLR